MDAGWQLLSEDIRSFRHSLDNCCIFLGENGQIGIISAAVRKGDYIYYIEGARKPCLLRARVGGGWILICGHCDIYGASDVFEEASRGFLHGLGLEEIEIW